MDEIKYHLNWDGKQNNGIIFNDTYTWGAYFEGEELKPKLSFNYYEFECSEVFDEPNWVRYTKDEDKTPLSTDQIDEIVEKAKSWVQPIGAEGNPSPEQIAAQEQQSENNVSDLDRITSLFNMNETDRDDELHNLAIKYDLPYTDIVNYYNEKIIEYGL